MDATAARTGSRFRARSRVQPGAAQRVTAHANPDKMGARVDEVTTRAPPNGRVSQRFIIQNNHWTIGNGDPDHCDTAVTPLSGGAEVSAQAVLGGQSYGSAGLCIGAATGPLAREEGFVLEHSVPSEPGTYTFTYQFFLAGSGQVFETLQVTIEVSGDAPDPPDRNGGNGGGNIIGDLFGDVQTGALVIVVLFIVVNALAPA